MIRKESKNEDSTLDDSKVKDILTGKAYVKLANTTSFITSKGEYEIPNICNNSSIISSSSSVGLLNLLIPFLISSYSLIIISLAVIIGKA